MSTVLVAAILVGFLVLFIVLFTMNENRKKRNRRNQFLTHFSELASLNSLTFSKQEILKDVAIGLDGLNHKLLVVNRDGENTFSHYLVYLNDVKSCSVKKQYGTVGAAGSKKNELEPFLEKVVLQFHFKNSREPAEVAFYQHISSDIYEMKDMSEKARQWEVTLSKLLKSPLKEAA
jgi:hypothetical protein